MSATSVKEGNKSSRAADAAAVRDGHHAPTFRCSAGEATQQADKLLGILNKGGPMHGLFKWLSCPPR